MIGVSRLLALVALLLAASSRAPAQDGTRQDRKRQLLEGTEVLRRILYDHEFTALEGFADLDDPSNTLLVILGDLRPLAFIPGGVDAFVRRGGAALLASDRVVTGKVFNELVAVAGVSINNETYYNVTDCYHGASYCPRLLPMASGGLGLFGLGEANSRRFNVYTNVPSKLRLRQRIPGIRAQAVLPPGSFYEADNGTRIPDAEFTPLFAVGGEVGNGRVLVLADHSVFINQMMLPEDTNNVEFSYNVVRWLQANQRNKVLFLEDGRVQTKLDIPLKSVALPPEEILKMIFAKRNELLSQAGNALGKMEDDNVFNNGLAGALDRARLTPDRLATLLAVFGTLLGMLYLIYRVGIRERFRHDTTVPPVAAELNRSLPDAPLARQRQRALIRLGDLREPAAILAGRWFARLGVDVLGPEPAFEASGGWWARRRLGARLRDLWRLAQGKAAARFGPAGLWRLQRELDALSASHQRGVWRIGKPDEPARIEDSRR